MITHTTRRTFEYRFEFLNMFTILGYLKPRSTSIFLISPKPRCKNYLCIFVSIYLSIIYLHTYLCMYLSICLSVSFSCSQFSLFYRNPSLPDLMPSVLNKCDECGFMVCSTHPFTPFSLHQRPIMKYSGPHHEVSSLTPGNFCEPAHPSCDSQMMSL